MKPCAPHCSGISIFAFNISFCEIVGNIYGLSRCICEFYWRYLVFLLSFSYFMRNLCKLGIYWPYMDVIYMCV